MQPINISSYTYHIEKMTTNQNPFEELFKKWADQAQDPKVLNGIMENFLKLQKNILSIYEKKDSSSSGEDLSHDLLNAIVRLHNRVNELEERLGALEKNASKPTKQNK